LDSCTATSGIGWFHGAWWIAGITECWYPVQYQLSPDRIRRLRETTDEIRRGGGRTSVYTNALMLSRASPEYELWGKDLATVGANGGIWFTEHDAHYHPMALPYPNEAWAARYTEALEKAVLLGQPDMLYLDQLGAVPAHLDFAPEKHGHTHYGEWTAGQTRFVRAVRERFCTRRADLALCIETPSAPVQQYANFALLGITPVYRYVFPNYHGMVGEYGEVAPATALANAESAFLVGEPLLLLGADLPKADAATRDAIRAIVRLKRQVDSLLGGARYRDTRGLALPPDVRASVFVADRRLLLPFVNRALAADRVIGCDPVALGVQVQGQVRLHAPGDAALPTVVLPRGPGAQLRLAVPPVAAGVIEVW
jgi:hypothetical protein